VVNGAAKETSCCQYENKRWSGFMRFRPQGEYFFKPAIVPVSLGNDLGFPEIRFNRLKQNIIQ
jgi:hypothetical protein